MALKLIIVSDFVCPYCYWLETLLDRLGEQLEIIHVPYQLTEPPAPRIDVWNDPVRRVRYAETLGPVCQAQGVEMCLPPRVIPRPYTDLAFQGWCFAGERDRGESFYKAVFQAYFVDERDIGDLSVLTELAENCGLSGQDFRAYRDRPPAIPPVPGFAGYSHGAYHFIRKKTTGRLCSELDRAEGMVGCGALRCLNVSIKYKKQVDRYEKIVEEKSQAKGRGTRR
jgi:2-hydroxychromene-2-carboxylate isomerase